jgi:hypothetical protein
MKPSDERKESLAVVWIAEAEPATYSLAAAARLGGVHPELLRHYWRLGLFGEPRGAEPVFDAGAVHTLRRFEHYRRAGGIDRRTLRLLFGLWRELEELRGELRILRERPFGTG